MSIDAIANLADPWWRLCNLYKIVDKSGQVIPFRPNPEQIELIRQKHNRNAILKARQKGMTTVIQIWGLDKCIFNPNLSFGVIAHSKEDAQAFFDNKIKFAYDNLPEEIRAVNPCRNDNRNELSFDNGSRIRVGTSLRSSTNQILHVSELGKIAATRPDKAKEIISGALNTVGAEKTVAFVESTAEGAYGEFYEMCRTAEAVKGEGLPLTPMDYKFFFFPWYTTPEYSLDTPVEIDQEHAKYFRQLDDEHGIKLTREQCNWYVKKAQEQGGLMQQEYPTTPEEAFHVETEGLIYAKQLGKVRRDGRICHVPYQPGSPVHTFWDLGRNDAMAIWFMQRIGFDNRFIDYHEDSGYDLEHYVVNVLKDKPYGYGTCYMPHDANVTDLSRSDNLSRKQVVEGHSLTVQVVPKVDRIGPGIEMTRQAFNSCYFDKKGCEDGLKALEAYKYEYDEKAQTNKRTPLHNWASNGADAFRQFAQGFRGSSAPQVANDQLARGRSRKAGGRRTGTSNRV